MGSGEDHLAAVCQQLEKSAIDVQEAELVVQNLLRKQAGLVHAQRVLQHKHLVSALQHSHLGFQHGKPTAAMVVHRCLLAWKSLEVTDTATQTFLHSIITVVTHALDENQLNKVAAGAAPLSPSTSIGGSGQLGTQVSATPNAVITPLDDSSSTQRVLAQCAYWLTVTSTLLALLYKQVPEHPSYLAGGRTSSGSQQRLGPDDLGHTSHASAAAAKLADIQSKIASTFSNFGRSILKRKGAAADEGVASLSGPQGSSGAASGTGAGTGQFDAHGHDVGAPTPGQVFRHSLDLLLLQSYSGVRDTIKKQLAPLLPSCVQMPEVTSPTQGVVGPDAGSSSQGGARGGDRPRTPFEEEADAARQHGPSDPDVRFTLDDSEVQEPEVEPGDAAISAAVEQVEEQVVEALRGPPPKGPLAAWEELVDALQSALDQLRAQAVPRILIKCVFKQLLGFIDTQLFNQLLLRPDCCCSTNARHLLSGLKLLDQWVVAGSEDAMMRPLYQELKHVRQAATFLVTPGKSKLSVDDITGSLCPALSAQQIYRLCTTCWDDAPTTPPTDSLPPPLPEPTSAPVPTEPLSDTSTGVEEPPPPPPVAAGGDEDEDDGVLVPEGGAVPVTPLSSAAGAMAGAVADLVSGEVLEALKGAGGGVQGNGGLLITFLLDEYQAPIIAPEGCTAPEVLGLIEAKELYLAIQLPPEFDTPTCPRAVFTFIEDPVPLPPHMAKA